MNSWLAPNLVECVGWTLLHFLWQGLLIAALLVGCLRLLRHATPNHRYLAGCLALLSLAIAPAITLPGVIRQYQLSPVSAHARNPAPTHTNASAIQARPATKIIFAPQAVMRTLDFAQRVETFLPWVVVGWSAGVVVLSLRLLAGWLQIQRLKRVATARLDEAWLRKLAELGRRLGLNRSVRLWQSALVEVPTVIGWLRPVILLPASCLVGLTPAQLEAILAHELAHIRRHDYLVNLLQSVVETFLFYHPAVWWVSRRVREEREHCCDDLAVEICGDRVAYARALATLEELRVTPAQLTLAAAGAPLLQRIRRLAGPSGTPRPAWPVAGIVVLLLALTNGLPASSPNQNTNLFELRTFHVDPNTFRQGLESASGVPFGNMVTNNGVVRYVTGAPSTNNLMRTEQVLVRQFFTAMGVDFNTNNPANAGKMFAWNNRRGILTVRTTSQELDLIDAAIAAFHPVQASPEVNIKVKFVTMNDPGARAWMRSLWGTATNQTDGPITGALTEPQYRAAIEALERRADVDELNVPEVTTESGRHVQIQTAETQASLARRNTAASQGLRVAGVNDPATTLLHTTNGLTVAVSLDPILDVIPYVLADESAVQLTLMPHILEFSRIEAAKPYVGDFPESGRPPDSALANIPNPPMNGMPLPYFRMRQVTNEVTLPDGQTVVLGGFNWASSTNTNRTLIIFVTPTIINPDGSRIHKAMEQPAAK